MRPHICVIDPAAKNPELEAFALISQLATVPVSYHLPALFGMASLTAIGDHPFAGIVVLGSLASVHDRARWQGDLAEWLRPNLLAGIPTLGICFGHQFIVSLFGGEIGFVNESGAKQVGCGRVVLRANSLWNDRPLDGDLCVSHNETVTRVPECMEVVGSSEEIFADVLAHRTLPVWTFQSHPEAQACFFRARNLKVPAGDPFEFGHRLLKSFLDFAAKGR